MKKQNESAIPETRIPIFDNKGRLHGHVGKKATAVTVGRFNVRNAKLGKKDGRTAWIGEAR
jgi:hypothetical protein